MAAKVNKDECTGCEACVAECPVECIAMTDGAALVDEASCIDCGACVSACPVECITMD